MFGNDLYSTVFAKLHRARKLDLICPCCGHLQEEPSIVFSSFCRSCGEHFRVRKGVAIANPALKVSGISEIRTTKPNIPSPSTAGVEAEMPDSAETSPPAGDDLETTGPPDSWLVTADEPESGARPLTRSDEEEIVGISAGAFFGLVGGAESPSDDMNKTDDAGLASTIGSKARSRGSLARGSIAALIRSPEPTAAADYQKMPPNFVAGGERRKASDSVPENPVRCFRCNHVQMVSRFAKSTQCERCSVYISLANYEINAVHSHTLRTRGDITITRKGGLVNGSEIACNHLTVSGAIDATVDCSGNAIFRHSGSVHGNLFCERLIIEKNCEVRFADGVMTDEAEILGHLIGDVICSGLVRIGRTGLIEGALTTVELETKDGGRVSGETIIDSAASTALPLKKGFHPTVIG